MIGAIIGIGTGTSFASLGTLSADPPLEIWSAISFFPMEMVNHPEEDFIRIHPSNDHEP
jgi:hypothetical protein